MILYIEKDKDDYYNIFIKEYNIMNDKSFMISKKSILQSDIEVTKGFKKYIKDEQKLKQAIKHTLIFVKDGKEDILKLEL